MILKGNEIDDIVVGGPAYDSRLLEKGDVVLQIDRNHVSVDDAQKRLIGSDLVNSAVVVTVRKKSGRLVDVTLKRIKSSVLSDRFRMMQLFSQSKVIFLLISLATRPLTMLLFRSLRLYHQIPPSQI